MVQNCLKWEKMPTYTSIGPVTAVTDVTNATRVLIPNQKVNVPLDDSWLLRLKALRLLRPIPPLTLDGSWALNGQHNLDGEAE